MTRPYSELVHDKCQSMRGCEKCRRDYYRDDIIPQKEESLKRHSSYFCFETQFECSNCKEQVKATLAMHKHSENKCQTIGFVHRGSQFMCNDCYYGIS